MVFFSYENKAHAASRKKIWLADLLKKLDMTVGHRDFNLSYKRILWIFLGVFTTVSAR